MSIELPFRYVNLEIQTKTGNSSFIYENKNGSGPRIEFNITMLVNGQGGGCNKAQFKIYNLSDDSFKNLTNNASMAILIAGSNKKKSSIFKGNIKTILRRRESCDNVTILYCSSNFNDKSIDSIITASVTSKSINLLLNEIAAKAKLKLDSDLTSGEMISNRCYFGPIGNILNELGRKFNFKWCMEFDTLFIRKYDGSPTQVFKYDPSSGLIKSPMITEKGVDIDVLLDPYIKPGDTFELSSKFSDYSLAGLEFVERLQGTNSPDKRIPDKDRYNGQYIALHITNEGSTHTNTWYTHIEGMNGKIQ